MSKFSNKTRFNWGFWDSINESKNGKPRTTVADSHHDTTNVSPNYCEFYYGGYLAGLEAFSIGKIPQLTTKAWKKFKENSQKVS